MKPEIAKLWAEELRSGKWKQGKEWLCRDGKHCCLGVLCELAIKQGVKVERAPGEVVMFAGAESLLPPVVREWAGVRRNDGAFPGGTLVDENDSGRRFKTIAALIEKHSAEL